MSTVGNGNGWKKLKSGIKKQVSKNNLHSNTNKAKENAIKEDVKINIQKLQTEFSF